MSSPLSSLPEGCDNSSSVPTEVRLNAAALADPSSLHIPISIPSSISSASAQIHASGLVDSGSTHCFVDPNFIKKHSLPTFSISPVTLRLLDGTVGAVITHAANLRIKFSTNDILTLMFYVTPLDSTTALVFGHNWLHRYNPSIDWFAGQLLHFRRLSLSVPSSCSPGSNGSFEPPATQIPSASTPPSDSSVPLGTTPLSSSEAFSPSEDFSDNSFSSDTPFPSVSFINAAAYARCARLPGSTVFTVTLHNYDSASAFAAQAKAFSAQTEPVDLSGIPEEYHEFADVFSESQAETLPEHRPYDLKIELEDGAEPPIGRMYALSAIEQEALRQFMDQNLRNGFIRPSRSPHGAPILFIKKKDGSLRLCIDYRGLNKLSKKDRYPLPLIADLLDSPGKARIYTKIDLRHAYHLVRIREGDEWKTTFRTKYGSFEWKVMPFGLTNAPGAFQRFMNDIFADMLDVCVVVYLDDILIYSHDKKTHAKQVKEVLRRLRKHKLYAKPEKCEFNKEKVEYLGYILTPDGLFMDPAKVKVLQDWPEPRKVREVQSFLGFANFYRRFIFNFSDIVIPLTRLTRKQTTFAFGDKERASFELLKSAFTSAPVLHHWVPDRPIIIETDASDYALAAILSIELESGEIHPVAFHSRSFNPTELNYDVHDKELFAIYEAFRIWRHYLDGSALPIDVVTDHKNLEYFATTKILNRRQARWSEYLCQFNLLIRFRPGKLGTKPDALTRRWDVYAKEGGNDYAKVNPHNFRPVFTREQLSSSLRATSLISAALRGSFTMDVEQLHNDIRTSYPSDPITSAHLQSTSTTPSTSSDKWTTSDEGLLLLNDRIYVPDVADLRMRVLKNKHDHPLSGHFGQNKTLELIRREYVWPKMRDFIKDYCNSCTICKRSKPTRHKPYGLLKQLPIPSRPWDSISMDFIEQLPPSLGFTAILVIVDRLSKQGIFIPTHDTITSALLAELFVLHVFSKHGVPSHCTSDRGSEFVSHFFRSLGKALDMKLHFTSGYHPQGDGQTERVNQTLEQYLRCYCNYQQDNWAALLPLAEFAYNNAPNETTGTSPFFANKGYHPNLAVHPERDLASARARDFAVDLGELHDALKSHIALAQQRYQKSADARRLPAPEFKVGQRVYVEAKFFRTTRPAKKLSEKYLGPYEIIGQVGSHSFTLRLPEAMRAVHPVFHVSMLEPAASSSIPNRTEDLPPPVEVDGEIEYEIAEILDTKLDRRFRRKLRYLVKWTGYEGTDEETTWISADELNHAQELVNDFHVKYPDKPGPHSA